MKMHITEYKIEGDNAINYHVELFRKASSKQLPKGVVIQGVEGGIPNMRFYLYTDEGASIKIDPDSEKLSVKVFGSYLAQKIAKTRLEEIFGGKI